MRTYKTLLIITLYIVQRAELAVQPKGGTTKVELQSKDNKSSDQSKSNSQIRCVNNNPDLLYRLKSAAKGNVPSIMFKHCGNDNNLKTIINHLVSVFEYVLIIDIDTMNYNNQKGLPYDVNAQPSLIFGVSPENFIPPRSAEVKSYISKKRKLELESYELTIELVIQRSIRDRTIQEHGAQDASNKGDKQDGIYHPRDADQLLNILQEADNSGKLCLIYLVIETDEYDYIFVELAKANSDTVFIKIDADNYKSSSCRKFIVQTQPAIIFYKSKRTTDALYSTDRDTISMNIQENLDF